MRSSLLIALLSAPLLLLGQSTANKERKVRSQLARGKAYAAARNATAMLLKGGHPEFLVLRAQAYNNIGEHGKAEVDARAAMQQLPANPEGLLQLALAEKGQGQLDSASIHLQLLQQRQPGPDARYQLALVQQSQGRLKEAMAMVNGALAADTNTGSPASAKLHRVKGELAALLGDTALAQRELDQAIALAPEDPVNYNSRGYFVHAWKGDHAGAIRDYDRALKLNPNYSYAFNNRGWSRYKLGETGAAIKDIERAKRRKAHNPFVYRNLGVIALETGDTAKACTLLRQALVEGFTALYGTEVEERIATSCANNGKPANAPAAEQPGKKPVTPRTNAPE